MTRVSVTRLRESTVDARASACLRWWHQEDGRQRTISARRGFHGKASGSHAMQGVNECRTRATNAIGRDREVKRCKARVRCRPSSEAKDHCKSKAGLVNMRLDGINSRASAKEGKSVLAVERSREVDQRQRLSQVADLQAKLTGKCISISE